MSVKVLSFRDPVPTGFHRINTTSSSKENILEDDNNSLSKYLSPFYVGGKISLYGNAFARNVENAWQYSKVYACHVDQYGDPTPEYFKWA